MGHAARNAQDSAGVAPLVEGCSAPRQDVATQKVRCVWAITAAISQVNDESLTLALEARVDGLLEHRRPIGTRRRQPYRAPGGARSRPTSRSAPQMVGRPQGRHQDVG
jgi:hypothetical protein